MLMENTVNAQTKVIKDLVWKRWTVSDGESVRQKEFNSY